MTDTNNYVQEISSRAKKASRLLKNINTKDKNRFLNLLADEILKSKEEILSQNSLDLQEGKSKNLSSSLLDRLLLNDKRLESLAGSVRDIANLPDPVGEVVRGLTLPNGVELTTKRVPLGVVLVIYESRPNVTIDVGALSFKSGNACILRGGSEAIHSNTVLSNVFRRTLNHFGLPEDALILVEKTDRALLIPLLKKQDSIDLVVPRGGEGLIRFVTENSTIPVVKHDKGVCNLFIDESADLKKSIDIAINSKVQRPGVCNAVENLILHKNFPHRKELLDALVEKGVEIIGDAPTKEIIPNCKEATHEEYLTEYLDLRISVKTVESTEEAIRFIEQYSSGHTEAIVSQNLSNIDKFTHHLDSAAIFVNCSTRFHDGGEFELGAEVGISTGKLHVRGPMGLIHLTTTTTYLKGDGQVRG